MKEAIPLLMGVFIFAGGYVVGNYRKAASVEEAPAIVWRSSNGTTLAVGTPSKGKSYFFNNLESVTFSAPKYKTNGVVITTKP